VEVSERKAEVCETREEKIQSEIPGVAAQSIFFTSYVVNVQ